MAWAEDSCPAGPAGAACRGPDADAGAPPARAPQATVPAPPPSSQSDLITQEMEELKLLLKMGDERLTFLRELQGAASEGKGLPLSSAQKQALTEGLPLLSEIAGQGDRAPIAAAEDFLVTKTALPMAEPVAHIEWLLLRNPRPSTTSSPSSTPQSQTPTCILVAVHAEGNVQLFSPTGELLLNFEAGHEAPITQIATSPTHEEHLLATGDATGGIRVHRISVRQRRVSKEERASRGNSSEEKLSQYLGPQLNVTTQLQRQLQLPIEGDSSSLTALAIANYKSSREIVAGDSLGRVSVFAKNGTLKSQVDATAMEGPGVEGLYAFHSQVIFRAGMEWGYVNLDRADVKHIDCPKFEGRVAAITVDSQQLSKVLLSDESGGVWVFNVKNRKECEFEKKFPYATDHRVPLELAAIRGFVIGLHKSTPSEFPTSSLLALNMSQHVGRRRPGELGPGGHVIWRRPRLPVRDWSVQRKQHGDLVALLSEDGREVEILEILMQVYTPPPSSDPFSNFKLPVMACAVVLLLGYQFMKQKGKGGGALAGLTGGARGGGGKFGKNDFASLLNKKKMGGLKKK